MIQKIVRIENKLGLHARAAAKFVNHTSRYGSDILVRKIDQAETQRVNGKSIMGIMMLAASRGTELELQINGDDEELMMDDIITLIKDRFGEDA